MYIYVDKVQFEIMSYERETLVIIDRVARETMICGQLCVGDIVVDESEKTSSAVVARAFSA